MTIAIWPTELKRPTLDGYSLSSINNLNSFQPEIGPPIIWRRSSARSRSSSYIFLANENGKARFERFFYEDIKGGTKPFLMEDPTLIDVIIGLENDNEILGYDDSTAIGIVNWWKCLFDANNPYQIQPRSVHGNWSVSINVIRLP